MTSARGPHWPLAGFYFVYFATLGAWLPFWPLYLQSIGHGALVIGMTSALFNVTRILAPNVWGALADRTGQRITIIRLGCFLAFLSFFGIFINQSAIWIAVVLMLFSFFWSAVLPQFEVVTLERLGSRRVQKYGPIRSWGSLGFIAAVLLLGVLFERVALSWFPLAIVLLLGSIWLSTLLISSSDSESTEPRKPTVSFRTLLGRRAVWLYLICVVLMQVSFGPYYSFISIHLEALNYSKTEIGLLWSLGVLAEILLFAKIGVLISLFGIRSLLLLSLFLTGLRWVVTGLFADIPFLFVLAQLIHAFSFGAFHVCMIEYVRLLFPGAHHGKGQALFSSLGYGLGAVLGATFSGLLWDWQGSWLFVEAGILAFVVLIWAFFYCHPAQLSDGNEVAVS